MKAGKQYSRKAHTALRKHPQQEFVFWCVKVLVSDFKISGYLQGLRNLFLRDDSRVFEWSCLGLES